MLSPMSPTTTVDGNFRPCSCASCENSSVTATLGNENLWRRFEKLGTEMIITKRGRRLFPTLKVKLRGLKPEAKYLVWLDVVPVDSLRYKFVNSRWVSVGSGDRHTPTRHVHSPVPLSGHALMKDDVSFHALKLTNQKEPYTDNQILLNSMHKYVPRLHITPVDNLSVTLTFTFPETEFVAVTAYQNDQVIQLKIDNNPFAKGFRENVLRKAKKRGLENENDIDIIEEKRKAVPVNEQITPERDQTRTISQWPLPLIYSQFQPVTSLWNYLPRITSSCCPLNPLINTRCCCYCLY